jgi:hypothetical protein
MNVVSPPFQPGIKQIQILWIEIPLPMRKSFHWSPRPHKRHTWSDREGSDVSAIQDQSFPKPTTASAASLNQIAVAGTVALLGISYMFNSMDRQVFPALLSAIIPQDGLTLPQAGFVSTALPSWWRSSAPSAAGSWRGSGARPF